MKILVSTTPARSRRRLSHVLPNDLMRNGTPRLVARFMIVASLPIILASAPAQAISLGGQNSGKKFDYEACGKIVEGKTKAADLDTLLKGEPVTTGKQAGRFIRSYQYTKASVLSGVGAFGINLGGNKATEFSCTVTHNQAGTVLTVDMQKVEVGSSGAGI